MADKCCKCGVCKRSTRLREIMAKLPKEDADYLQEVIECFESESSDLEIIRSGLDMRNPKAEDLINYLGITKEQIASLRNMILG